MKRPPVSLRFSLSSAFVSIVVVTALGLGTVTFLSARWQLRESLRQRLGDVAAAASFNIDPGEHELLREEGDMELPVYQKYREQFRRLKKSNPDIGYLYTMRRTGEGDYVFVLDSGETEEEFSPLGSVYEDFTPTLEASFSPPYQVRVETDFYTDQWGTWLSSFAPLMDQGGRLVGVLGLDMSAARVVEYETGFLSLIGGFCLGVSLLGALAGILFSRRLVRPLLSIAGDMEQIQKLDLAEEPPSPSRIREVIFMTESLQNMKKGLRSFKKYVPADVVRQLISLRKEAALETEQRNLTVFFSDLENFTGFSELLPPEELAQVLAPYFQTMTATLQDHRATIDKFIGDSVMAFWNAPEALEDHPVWACRAALACQRNLKVLAEKWKDRGLPPIRTRIGINTGPAVVGNIGYPERLNYTTLGDTVNLASRLESLNKYYGTGILLGEETWEAVRGTFKARMVDRVTVKGKTRAVGIYELLTERDLPAGWSQLLEAYSRGWEAYVQRQWDQAEETLQQALKFRPADGPSLVLLERVRRYRKDPPPEGWDGSLTMDSK